MNNKFSPYNYILNITILVAVCWFLAKNIEDVSKYNFQFDWLQIFACFCVIGLSYLVMILIWSELAKSFGLNAPLLLTGKALLVGQLGKYVPGKITILLARFNVYQGYSKRKVTIATGVEYISMLAAAFLLVFISLTVTPHKIPDIIRWSAIIGAMLFLFFLYPPISLQIINFILKSFNRDTLDTFPAYRQLLKFIGAYLCIGLTHGMALYLLLNSLSPIDSTYYLLITGAYETAGLIGIAAIFAPSGIGVREGILFMILPIFIPTETAIIGIIVIRLLTTIMEILLAGIFVLLERVIPKKLAEK